MRTLLALLVGLALGMTGAATAAPAHGWHPPHVRLCKTPAQTRCLWVDGTAHWVYPR